MLFVGEMFYPYFVSNPSPKSFQDFGDGSVKERKSGKQNYKRNRSRNNSASKKDLACFLLLFFIFLFLFSFFYFKKSH
jgi:hypothetical protein